MFEELYEGLKKIYEDFFSQKNMLDEKKDYYTNDNEYQNYVEKLTEGFSTVSFYAEGEEGEYSLLDTIEDSTHQTVEDEVISRINIETIRTALSLLNRDDFPHFAFLRF